MTIRCLACRKYVAYRVFMRQEKPSRESVSDAEKLYYLLLPPANVQILRIGEADPDPYFLDEEVQYISLDAPIEIEVLDACIN